MNVHFHSSRRWRFLVLLCLVILLLLGAARSTAAPNSSELVKTSELDDMVARAHAVRTFLVPAVEKLETEYRAIERRLLQQRADSLLVQRITAALLREAWRNALDARLLTGVLLVENPWLAPDTTSFMGAIGLMQVMPQHAGAWGCGSDDLTDIDVNICHGARIFAHNLRRTGGDVHRALLYYNGCVRGANTPDCWRYPDHVRRYAAGVYITEHTSSSSD